MHMVNSSVHDIKPVEHPPRVCSVNQPMSMHPGPVDESRGDPGLAGDPGAVGHIVLEQLEDQRAEVHV